MRLSYQVRIPILGGRRQPPSNPKSPIAHALRGTLTPSDYRNIVNRCERQTRSSALIKPGRRLGGGWIDDFVSCRRAVALCDDCRQKYGDWHLRSGYAVRDLRELTDCDGCGEFRLATGYFARLI